MMQSPGLSTEKSTAMFALEPECGGCNASKGQKQLSVWLQSKYCKEHDINLETVAPIVKQAIKRGL